MILKFMGGNRAGRAIVRVIHRAPIHRNWSHPMRFVYGGCWLCNLMVSDIIDRLGDEVPDQSHIQYSQPEIAEDGTVIKHGISMSATVERQLKELAEVDAARYEALLKVMDEIARDPKP